MILQAWLRENRSRAHAFCQHLFLDSLEILASSQLRYDTLAVLGRLTCHQATIQRVYSQPGICNQLLDLLANAIHSIHFISHMFPHYLYVHIISYHIISLPFAPIHETACTMPYHALKTRAQPKILWIQHHSAHPQSSNERCNDGWDTFHVHEIGISIGPLTGIGISVGTFLIFWSLSNPYLIFIWSLYTDKSLLCQQFSSIFRRASGPPDRGTAAQCGAEAESLPRPTAGVACKEKKSERERERGTGMLHWHVKIL